MRCHYTSTIRVGVIISHSGGIREDLKTHVGGLGCIGGAPARANAITGTSGSAAASVDNDNKSEKDQRVLRTWYA